MKPRSLLLTHWNVGILEYWKDGLERRFNLRLNKGKDYNLNVWVIGINTFCLIISKALNSHKNSPVISNHGITILSVLALFCQHSILPFFHSSIHKIKTDFRIVRNCNICKIFMNAPS